MDLLIKKDKRKMDHMMNELVKKDKKVDAKVHKLENKKKVPTAHRKATHK